MEEWKKRGNICLWCSLIPLALGFYKMYIYNDSYSSMKNAYVGGDAYNYIINANYATGYFVLALILLVAAIGCGIMYYLSGINEKLDLKSMEYEFELTKKEHSEDKSDGYNLHIKDVTKKKKRTLLDGYTPDFPD